MIRATHVPPDRYIIGNIAKIFPIFSPDTFRLSSKEDFKNLISSNTFKRFGVEDKCGMLTKSCIEELKVSAESHAGFGGFMEMDK